MLARKYPELERPVRCAKRLSLRERWRDYQFQKHIWKMDQRALEDQIRIDARDEGLAEGRAEGLAEGLAEGKTEGLTEGKLEIARKMKIRGNPLTEIAEITGLAPEEIDKISC